MFIVRAMKYLRLEFFGVVLVVNKLQKGICFKVLEVNDFVCHPEVFLEYYPFKGYIKFLKGLKRVNQNLRIHKKIKGRKNRVNVLPKIMKWFKI